MQGYEVLEVKFSVCLCVVSCMHSASTKLIAFPLRKWIGWRGCRTLSSHGELCFCVAALAMSKRVMCGSFQKQLLWTCV